MVGVLCGVATVTVWSGCIFIAASATSTTQCMASWVLAGGTGTKACECPTAALLEQFCLCLHAAVNQTGSVQLFVIVYS